MTHLTTSRPVAWQCRCQTVEISSYLCLVMQPVKYRAPSGSGAILPAERSVLGWKFFSPLFKVGP